MTKRFLAIAICALSMFNTPGQLPENLVVEGVPPIPEELKARAGRYLDFRSASFESWHPVKREMLITTRFGETAQLHSVASPGAARKQLTFQPERILGGWYQPKHGAPIEEPHEPLEAFR